MLSYLFVFPPSTMVIRLTGRPVLFLSHYRQLPLPDLTISHIDPRPSQKHSSTGSVFASTEAYLHISDGPRL